MVPLIWSEEDAHIGLYGGDSVFSREELEDTEEEPWDTEALFQEFDANGDGVITREEFDARFGVSPPVDMRPAAGVRLINELATYTPKRSLLAGLQGPTK